MSFDQLFKDIQKLDRRLFVPRDFYQSKQTAYLATARLVASRVLLAAIPLDHQADPQLELRWKKRVEITLDRITAVLLLGGWGMVLTISEPPASEGGLDPDKSTRPFGERVSHKDVVEWIRAGVAGIEGGKRITDVDRQRLADPKQGENGLASIIMRAYYSRKMGKAGEGSPNYVRLRQAIQRYLSGALDKNSGSELLDAVAAAWIEHFSLRFPRDLRIHVTSLVRDF